MINREIVSILSNTIDRRKVILLFGARQVGKTTLLKTFCQQTGKKTLFLNGDESDVRTMLTEPTSVKLRLLFGDNQIVVIDEAQNIENIGTVLKIAVDNIPDVQIIATGSSAFELANRANEPLTGRKYELMLFPLSFSEMVKHHGFLAEMRMLEHRMVFGYYPEIVTGDKNAKKHLKLLAGSYLFKDLLRLGQLKIPKLLEKILLALAHQLGSEVSYHEIAQLVGTDGHTVEKYIDLMEQAYIIFRLPALSRNVRNEIKKGKKIYFYDLGIRNALIGNFLPLQSRSDTGALWENFLLSERRKLLSNFEIEASTYFWRTTQQQEIDYIEERDGKIFAYEFKWSKTKQPFLSKTFSDAYPLNEYKIISKDNCEEFILQQ
jgi:hypothetical protein